MIRIREVLVVEGKYDKNTLKQVVDATVMTTSGFSIFKDKKMLELLKKAANERGLIILTDSDGAGFVIRNFLKGVIPASNLKHAYIPDIYGKEKRKAAPSAEGKLGVEGMRPQVIENALRQAGATIEGESKQPRGEITRTDLYLAGLSGQKDSRKKRRQLLHRLGLPEHLSTGGLMDALNLIMTRDEFFQSYVNF